VSEPLIPHQKAQLDMRELQMYSIECKTFCKTSIQRIIEMEPAGIADSP
jgi:hypothetical protein